VIRLGLPDQLALGCTNAIESLMAVLRQVCRNVKRWRDARMALRWTGTPAAWKRKPAKNRQKDKDARWTKKHGRSFYGYKNHVNADARYKLIRRYDVSDAAVHDSQKLDGLLNEANTSADVFADSAYRSAETEAGLKARGFRSPEEEPRPSSPRACVRSTGDFSRKPARADNRHRQSANEDWTAEPRVQYSPSRDVGADGCGVTTSRGSRRPTDILDRQRSLIPH
jgi:hypothetical protein